MSTRSVTIVLALVVLALVAIGLYQVRGALSGRVDAVRARVASLERELLGEDGLTKELERQTEAVALLEEKANLLAEMMDGLTQRVEKAESGTGAARQPAAVDPDKPSVHIALGKQLKVDDALARRLALTPDQVQRVNQLLAGFYQKEADELAKGVTIVRHGGGVAVTTSVRVDAGEREQRWKQFIDDQLGGVLTAEQLAKFREMFPTPEAAQ